LGVASDEAAARGDENTSPDWLVIDAHEVDLRAERGGPRASFLARCRAACIDATCGNQRGVLEVVRHLVALHREPDAGFVLSAVQEAFMSKHIVSLASVVALSLVIARSAAATPPVITGGPAAFTSAPTGGSVTLSVFTQSPAGCGNLSYQWQLNQTNLQNGSGITGAQDGTLQLTGVTTDESGNYDVVVTCSASGESTTSSTAQVLIEDLPVIVNQPQSATVSEGQTAQFRVGVGAACDPLVFDWSLNGSGLSDGPNVFGSNRDTLILSSVTASQAGTLRCIVYCQDGGPTIGVLSGAATLTVKTTHGFFTSKPKSTMVTVGQTTTLSVATSADTTCGTANVRWQLDGVNLSDGSGVTGSATSTLKLANATVTQTGSYRAVLTCSKTGVKSYSESATVTVNPTAAPTTQPVIIMSLQASAIANGSSTISWTLAGGAPTTLTLTPSNGVPVSVLGTTSLAVSPTASTIYTLTASNARATYSQNVAVVVGGFTAITACKAITAPGNYQVSTNLSSTSKTTSCLDVHDTSDVYIHCTNGATLTGPGQSIDPVTGGKTGGGIGITHVQNFSVDGCKIRMPTTVDSVTTTYANVSYSGMGVFSGNTFGNTAVTYNQAIALAKADYVTFVSNTVANSISATSSTGITVANNTLTNAGANVSGQVMLEFSAINQVVHNTMDGTSTGPGKGVDDNIVVGDVSGDLYANNTLKRTYDSAIEWGGNLRNSNILNNTITTSASGILSSYNAGMSGSMISGNNISNLSDLSVLGAGTKSMGMRLIRFCALRPAFTGGQPDFAAETSAPMAHNMISSNVIVNNSFMGVSFPLPAVGGTYDTCSSDETPLTADKWIKGDNVFKNNDYGTGVPFPTFESPSVSGQVVDGGGNKCTHPTPAGYPIVCH
jgi:hypothetical protein